MEHKVIIYIIAGIIYLIYTASKKAQEKQPPSKSTRQPETPAKPVSPPTGNPMEDVIREIRRKQQEAEQKRRALQAETEQRKKAARTELATAQKKLQQKAQEEFFIHEKKMASFGQGAADAPEYEYTSDEQKILKADEAIAQQRISSKIPTAEEMAVQEETYQFDARQAFTGSVIFERKY